MNSLAEPSLIVSQIKVLGLLNIFLFFLLLFLLVRNQKNKKRRFV
jgi:hypothetical protein